MPAVLVYYFQCRGVFRSLKSVGGTSNPSVFAALSQHPSATIDGRLPCAHENLAAFPESPRKPNAMITPTSSSPLYRRPSLLACAAVRYRNRPISTTSAEQPPILVRTFPHSSAQNGLGGMPEHSICLVAEESARIDSVFWFCPMMCSWASFAHKLAVRIQRRKA
jgi:hypothetical protein